MLQYGSCSRTMNCGEAQVTEKSGHVGLLHHALLGYNARTTPRALHVLHQSTVEADQSRSF